MQYYAQFSFKYNSVYTIVYCVHISYKVEKQGTQNFALKHSVTKKHHCKVRLVLHSI